MEDSNSEEEEEEFDKEDLGTILRPKYIGAHKGFYEVDNLLGQLEREISSLVWVNVIPGVCKRFGR